MSLGLFVRLVMRLQSHLNRKQRGRKQRAECREQNKSGAIRTVCVSFMLYRLFAPQGQATRAEGVVECASTRDPDALPQAPTPKSLSKSGFALSPGRRFLPLPH